MELNQKPGSLAAPTSTQADLATTAGANGHLSAPTEMSSVRFLIAEDNAVNQKLALRQLQKLGYQADVVANGLEALAALQAQSYDIVLMDCQMPEMDGFEATREIRQREAQPESLHHTTIIAMTANALMGDRERCLAVGMDDYITKPVKPADLEALLTRWVHTITSPPESSHASDINGVATSSEADSDNLEGVLDEEVLENLRDLQMEGEPDLLSELAGIFLADCPARLQELQAASATQDASALTHSAHTLKSSSGNMGANNLSKLCAQVEECGRTNNLHDVPELLSQLMREAERAQKALQQEIEKVSL